MFNQSCSVIVLITSVWLLWSAAKWGPAAAASRQTTRDRGEWTSQRDFAVDFTIFKAHSHCWKCLLELWLPFLDLERRSKSIFGIQSAPPLWTYIWCWECAPLSTHIWHSERPRFQAINGVESVPCAALSLKMGVKAPPRSGPQILVKSGGCPPKYCQIDSNVVWELYSVLYYFYGLRVERHPVMHPEAH